MTRDKLILRLLAKLKKAFKHRVDIEIEYYVPASENIVRVVYTVYVWDAKENTIVHSSGAISSTKALVSYVNTLIKGNS